VFFRFRLLTYAQSEFFVAQKALKSSRYLLFNLAKSVQLKPSYAYFLSQPTNEYRWVLFQFQVFTHIHKCDIQPLNKKELDSLDGFW